MAEHHAEIIGIVLLLVFAATMFYQGTMIIFQQRGYSQNYIKRDLERMRQRVENLLQEEEDNDGP